MESVGRASAQTGLFLYFFKVAAENLKHGRRIDLPKLSHKSRKTIQTLKEQSFNTNGTALFNSLPKEIRNMKTVNLMNVKLN